VMILGRYLRRDDKKVLTAGDGGPRVGDEPLGHHISIFDAQAEKVFFLFPDTRQFRPPQPIHVSPRDDSIKTETSKPARQVDFYERLRGLPSDKAEKLPDRTIDGQRAIGYRFVWKNEQKDGAEHFTGTTIRDIWADPRTKLPVRIEHKMRSTNPKEAGGDWVFSDFIWDAPLDRSLFSMTPPEGYKEKK